MEIRIGMRLQVVRAADAGVGHDRRAAARLVGRRAVAIAAGTVAERAVEGVVASELMAHLVRDEIDVEIVAGGIGQAGRAASLAAAAADDAESSDAAAAGREHVADVVVGRADRGADDRGGVVDDAGTVAGERIAAGGRVHDEIVVRHQRELDRHVVLIHLGHAVDCDNRRRKTARGRAAADRGDVLVVGCDGGAVDAFLYAGLRHRCVAVVNAIDRRCAAVHLALPETVGRLDFGAAIAQVTVGATGDDFGTYQPGTVLVEHHRLETERRDVETNAAPCRVAALEAEDVRIFLLQFGRHRARIDHHEFGEAAFRQRQRDVRRDTAGMRLLEVSGDLRSFQRQRAIVCGLRCIGRRRTIGIFVPVMVVAAAHVAGEANRLASNTAKIAGLLNGFFTSNLPRYRYCE
jgi:hypothetical protein